MERRAIIVEGIVQGVGFRPFVYRLAERLELCGRVQNRTGGVLIEAEGEPGSLECFLEELAECPPPLARIERLSWKCEPPRGETRFRIVGSGNAGFGDGGADQETATLISPDVATCNDCLAELFDPADRRHRYPFLNCTNCGPRLTIMTGVPYDRVRTTMSGFALCSACRAEYEDPANRWFHAQPIACPDCGPRLRLLDTAGRGVESDDPPATFGRALRDGAIGALKGLGGYHLACDARSESVVSELRRRKHRDEKPFAVMVRDLIAAERLCEVSAAERELLLSPRRPIVLLRRRSGAPIAEAVAPGAMQAGCEACDGESSGEGEPPAGPSRVRNPLLGVMLPYTPLHHLLLRELDDLPLVMTSGNRSDEPIAYENQDAIERLAGIADLFLVHDRPIQVRCEDSVTRLVGSLELPVRRSRGYAPQPIPLPFDCPQPILAVGGQLKGTFALGRGRYAVLSHHLGDLDDYRAWQAFEKDIALYEELFSLRPRLIVCDLHPDYASTRYAMRRGGGTPKAELRTPKQIKMTESASSIRLGHSKIRAFDTVSDFPLTVQHHHAHMASCMAEHGLREPVIGVTFDGTGYGTDGAIWGGEFLVGDYRSFRRAAHLRYVSMPGGDRAVREPWRMAAAHLIDAGCGCASLRERVSPSAWRTLEQMLHRGLNSPATSSAGRLFDAVAALIGLRDRVSYEGQAAMELEWLASGVAEEETYPFEIVEDSGESRTCEPPRSFQGSVTRNQEPVRRRLALEPTPDPVGGPPLVIDTRPLIRTIARDVARGRNPAGIARRFHSTLGELTAAVCIRVRQTSGLNAVVLSGGTFMNALLTEEVVARLGSERFRVYRHHLVPPNDGGLSLGQLAIAAAVHNRSTR